MVALVKFINLLLSGVFQVFSMILDLPEIITASLSFLPSTLAGVLICCFGIVLVVRVLELLP